MTSTRDIGGMVVSVILTLIGVCAWNLAGDFSDLGAIFPKTFSLVLIFCSVGYFLLGLFGIARAKLKGDTEFLGRGCMLFVVLMAWCWLMPRLGFIISSFLGYLVLSLLSNHISAPTVRSISVNAGIGFVVVAGFYGLFSQLLGVPLPMGILEF